MAPWSQADTAVTALITHLDERVAAAEGMWATDPVGAAQILAELVDGFGATSRGDTLREQARACGDRRLRDAQRAQQVLESAEAAAAIFGTGW